MWSRRVALACVLLALVTVTAGACTGSGSEGGLKVVASFYPLAWAAQQVGGDHVTVEDLTPPGVEAHDTVLTAGQQADLQSAPLVLILGRFGFQPDVEQAAAEASGRVVAVTGGMHLLPSQERGLGYDPHVWLDPVLMEQIVTQAGDALIAIDPAGKAGYIARESATVEDLRRLDTEYRSGLANCAFTTFVATHEAFGYLADRYGLTQLGIEGLTPESEPSAARIQAAVDAIRAGTAGPAVFYEDTAEGKRVGASVAGDAGVPALALGTLEFDPSPGTYLSVMRSNLSNLRDGLRCR